MSDGILGVVLAGGLATRMGGFDKGLLRLGQQTILDEVLERLHPQVDDVVLNVNGDVERFGSFGLPCIADSLTGYLGPLAGVLAALEYARERQFIGLLRSRPIRHSFRLISSLGPWGKRWKVRPPSFLHQALTMRSQNGCAIQPLVSGTCRSRTIFVMHCKAVFGRS